MKQSGELSEVIQMSFKRILPLGAVLALGLGFVGPALPASAGVTYCWTVFRDAPVYSTPGGPTQVGSAFVGDTFENIDGIVSGAWRYGQDDETGAFGWIANGDLTHGVPCG
jgi:hypothetical protein